MTRRKFIQKLIGAGSAVAIGGLWPARKAMLRGCRFATYCKRRSPRRFIQAVRLKKYPGSLRALRNISKQSKWSG